MKQGIVPYFGLLLLLGVTGFLTIQAIWSKEAPDEQFSQRVNLALRQTVDGLLRLEEDSTSRIKPVRQTAPSTWLIPLEQNFNYDSLPALLHRAFSVQNIKVNYNVTVLDCYKKDLMLGYNSETYLSGEEVPCGGRERVAGCYQLTVTFLDAPQKGNWQFGIWIILLGAFVVLQSYQISQKKKSSKIKENIKNQFIIDDKSLQFGHSILDISNQKLWVQDVQKDLTYREAKLLQFFCQHQNQLLERDQILKSVWEDEGILVGRSLDVFVSRLRKLLKEDKTLKIVNVHSVGYRFEIRNNGILE